MICRNCSAVIPDDSEKCPSCGRDPEKRGRSRKTAFIIFLLSLIIFSSCVAIAVRINRTPAEPTSASSTSVTSESSALFALKTTLTQSETTVCVTETKPTESTCPKDTKSFKDFEVETFTVSSAADGEKTERALIKADKEDFQKNGKDYIETICRSIISKNSYIWLTVDFGDSTGIVFLSDNTGGADYGKIDENGLISELYGSFIISRQADYSYFSVASTEASQVQTSEANPTESKEQTTGATTIVETSTTVSNADSEADTVTESQPTEPKPTESEPNESKTQPIETTDKASDSVSDSTVYITNTGSKYHRDGCSSLNKSRIKIDRDKAINEGYEPCKRCKP